MRVKQVPDGSHNLKAKRPHNEGVQIVKISETV